MLTHLVHNESMKVERANPLLSTEKVQVSVRLSKPLMEQIDKVAEDNAKTRTEVMEQILAQALTNSKFVLKLS